MAFIPCTSDGLKRIKKGSGYYRQTMQNDKPKGSINYKGKLEKQFWISVSQGYVNQVTEKFNSGTNPPSKRDVRYLGKQEQGKR